MSTQIKVCKEWGRDEAVVVERTIALLLGALTEHDHTFTEEEMDLIGAYREIVWPWI